MTKEAKLRGQRLRIDQRINRKITQYKALELEILQLKKRSAILTELIHTSATSCRGD